MNSRFQIVGLLFNLVVIILLSVRGPRFSMVQKRNSRTQIFSNGFDSCSMTFVRTFVLRVHLPGLKLPIFARQVVGMKIP